MLTGNVVAAEPYGNSVTSDVIIPPSEPVGTVVDTVELARSDDRPTRLEAVNIGFPKRAGPC